MSFSQTKKDKETEEALVRDLQNGKAIQFEGISGINSGALSSIKVIGQSKPDLFLLGFCGRGNGCLGSTRIVSTFSSRFSLCDGGFCSFSAFW